MSPEGVVVFGDALGRFAVTLMGLGEIKISWGSSEGGSSLTRKLVVGVNHHLASTWEDGEQRYYIDGQPVFADDRRGAIAILGEGPPGPVRLGSDQPGVDVTLGEPTVWVGHVLTSQEAADLASREVRVGEVAPEAIALRWSLAGPDGEAARIGDIGLSDASSSHLDLISIEGSAPVYRGSILTVASAKLGSVQVAPSGRSIVAAMLDATGALAPIQSLLSADDLQVISVTGSPSGSSLSLNYGGHATSSIPYALGPPATSMVFSCQVAPGSYDLQAFWPASLMSSVGTFTNHATYQVFDGQVLLGTVVFDQTTAPTGFVDPYPANTSDYFVRDYKGIKTNPWQPMGTFTLAGTTLNIYLSAPATPNTLLGAGSIRVQPHGSTDPTLVNYLDTQVIIAPGVPSTVTATQNGVWTFKRDYPGTNIAGVWYYATPTGTANTINISAPLIQSALAALPNVPSNSVVVSTLSATSVQVHFTGALGNGVQPSLVSSDPATTVYHDNSNGSFVGGQYPSITINGGASIPLKYPIWGVSGGYQHYIVYPLPQASRTPQILSAGVGLFSATDLYNWTIQYGQGYAGGGGIGVYQRSSLATATFPFQGLTAATYRVSATWTPAAGNCPAALFTVQDGSGNALGSATFDQTTVPMDFSDSGAGWKVIGTFTTTALTSTFNVVVSFGNQAGNLIVDTVRVDRMTADSSVSILSTDVVKFSAPAGFAVTTSGPVPAQVGVLTSNQVGGTLVPAFVSGPKTMKVGYDIEGEQNLGLIPIYANLAHRTNFAGGGVTLNADGYPVSGQSNKTFTFVSLPSPDVQGLGKGLPNVDSGTYTVMWDGPSTTTIALNPNASTTVTENLSAAMITSTTNNRRVFDVEDPHAFAPILLLSATSTTQNPDKTWAYSVSNLRIYPPGVDPNNPPQFHPALTKKVQGVGALRFLDPLGTNNSGIVQYSDFGSASNLTYVGSGRTASATIASIGPDTSSPRFFSPNAASLLVTTTTPHGFVDGCHVTLHGTLGTVDYTDGGTGTIDNYDSLVHVTSPTTFLFPAYRGNGQSSTMTNTLTPTGATATTSFAGEYYLGWIYFTDCIALCNQAGADMWVNVPALANDACVTAMATAIATNLNHGLKVHVEYSNECWNYQFDQWAYCFGKSQITGGAGGDYSYFYVTQAVHVHNLFLAAFTAAGRPTTDVRRVLGTQGSLTNVTSNLLTRLTAMGATFDELATAPYYGNDSIVHTPEVSLEPIFDFLTVDQLIDMTEMNIMFGGLNGFLAGHVPVLQAAGFGSVKMVTYEGGLSGVVPNATLNSANANARNHAGMRHPRMYALQLAFNQILQDQGCTLFNHFFLAGGLGAIQGQLQAWSIYEGLNEPFGTGSPIADAANIATPENIPAIKCQRAGAIRTWQMLANPTSPVLRITPFRNGQVRTNGFPRGMSRPTR